MTRGLLYVFVLVVLVGHVTRAQDDFEDYHLDGVLGLDGSFHHKVPASEVPGISGNGTVLTRSFYVSCSVYLTEGATGEYRAVFFKGKDNSDRTPSLWLLPDSNQVTYRVKGEKEIYSTSRHEIALNRWTHLTLTFGQRPGFPGPGQRARFVMALYLDGEIDSEIEMKQPPVLNMGDLCLGNDVGKTSKGMSGFMSRVEVAVGATGLHPLSPLEVKRKYERAASGLSRITGRESHRVCEKEDLDAIIGPRSLVPPPREGICPRSEDWDVAGRAEDERGVFKSNWLLLHESVHRGSRDLEKVPAILQLAWKNWMGLDENPKSCEASLFYMEKAARIASDNYQKPGQQYHAEEVLLSERVHHQRQDDRGTESDDSYALQSMSEGGSADAALTLGNRAFYGHQGWPKNMSSALSYYKLAHELRSEVGTIALAKMLLRGDLGADADEGGSQRGVELYQEITDRSANNVLLSEAHNGLGFAHFYGKGDLEPNRTLALLHFEKAALRGSSQGALNAALLLNSDGADAESTVKAVRYFKRAAADGNALANYYLAIFKARGGGGEDRNCTEAFERFWVMARVGPWANDLGDGLKHYLGGRLDEAYESYRAAAAAGYVVAAHNIVFMMDQRRQRRGNAARRLLSLDEGSNHLLADDPSAAPILLDLILRGQEVGPALRSWAHAKLGDCYQYGKSHGCSVADPIRAVGHYNEAIRLDSIPAHFSLGDLYLAGAPGVERNETEAFRLFSEGREKSGRDLASTLTVWAYSALSVLGKLALIM